MMPNSAGRPEGSTAHAPRRPARGFVMITMICCLVVLMAFLGLAIDAGYLEWVKTRLQTAADAAAVGGAQEIRANGTANVVAAARADAALNGFTHGSNGVTVTVNNPPGGGYSTDNSTGVEVIVAQQTPTFFMRLIGASAVGLQARAVARLGSGPNCVYVLDPAGSGAFSASGGSTVAIACGVMVASGSSTAFKVSGGTAVTASSIAVNGGKSITGVGSTATPEPVTGVAPASDPLGLVSAPDVGACEHTNTAITSHQNVRLPPGVYCNGISVSGGGTVTFSPQGTYVLKGGGLSISAGSIISGNGVTFYNTAGGGYSYRPISISGNATVNLAAPTSGKLAGILFFQDRSIVSSAVNSVSGESGTTLSGALYFPTTPLSYSGGTNNAGAYTLIVAKTASFSGGCTINNDYSSLPAGSPIKGSAILSE
jgi:hypothetical protein